MYGAGDVRIEDVPDPAIHAPADAIVRVLRAAICGSDLHPYRSMPATGQGRQMGHEFLGIIEDTGAAVTGLKRGDLVLSPFTYWGTNPGQALPLGASVPAPGDTQDPNGTERALTYMGLTAGTPLRQVAVDVVFLGSCTNGRIEDLRAAADVIKGRKVADGVRMLVVPGSMQVHAQAEAEGLAEVFAAAGAEWRSAGCSMCLGMNPDTLKPGERSASTSNRNFEGRQGKGGRTHLVSPAVAAATAVTGRLTAPADL